MAQWLQRTQLLIGEEGIAQLAEANVLVIGLGGVGSYAAEFLARAGVGKMTIVDGDVVDITNVNRQLPALTSTVGQSKATLMAARLKDINSSLQLTVINEFLTPERMLEIITPQFDFALDCIDSIQPKLYMIGTCVQKNIRIISAMGAGGRLDPSQLKIVRLDKTYNCPFAQQIRKSLHKKGISHQVMVVYSSEPVDKKNMQLTEAQFKKSYYGTISYVPAAFGLYMASYVVRELLQKYVSNPAHTADYPKSYENNRKTAQKIQATKTKNREDVEKNA